MALFDLHKLTNEKRLSSGKILIAQPFMADSSFSRSVVFLCEHSKEGSLGFILNQPTDVNIGDLLPDLFFPMLKISTGGPVQLDTLHMLHRLPEVFGGMEIGDGVYWGGSFDMMKEAIAGKTFNVTDVRLFVGYSGWSAGQLENELKEGSWLIGDASQDVVFDTLADDVWKEAIYSLGKEYRYLANQPLDPRWN